MRLTALQVCALRAAEDDLLYDRKSYFVKERVAIVKLSDTRDILDPESKAPVGVAKEAPPFRAKHLRLLITRKLLPTT